MTRRLPFPRSLRGQLLLLLLGALLATQAVSLVFFFDERRTAVRAALGLEAAGRAANVVRLIEEAPPELREAILRSADSPLVRFRIGDAPALEAGSSGASPIARRVRQALAGGSEREVRAEVRALSGDFPMRMEMRMGPGMQQAMRAQATQPIEMVLAIALSDGSWLNVQTMFHRPPLQWNWASVLSVALMALAIVAVVWFAVRQIAGPMNALAAGADRLGRGVESDPLPVTGPSEVRRVTEAFNMMQARLTRFISERTQMLAALGHDLRSPLTAMRIRLELLEEDENRERLAAMVDEMQLMVESTLDFARGLARSEPSARTDLAALVRDAVSEVDPAGGKIAVAAEGSFAATVRPASLKRAVRNLLENAARYGESARVTLARESGSVAIRIDDDGPGIPEADLARVFDPFVRLEGSRSRETGGIGLGLAIVRTIIHAHGGEIGLENRPGGGLRATVRLPVEGA